MLTTNRKGTLAEAKIAAAAIEAGVGVARPLDDERYDLIFDLGVRLLRVQCKWAVRRGDVVVITCRTNRRGPRGFVTTVYSAHEIDVIAAYCAETGRSYLLPPQLSIGRTGIQLRLVPPRNNQSQGIHEAREFELEATLRRLLGP